MTGIISISILLLSLLLLIFENLAASFFWKFFYRKWPERLILEEELDRELYAAIQQRERPKGYLSAKRLDAEYKIVENCREIYLYDVETSLVFFRLGTIRTFGTATIVPSRNGPKMRLYKKSIIAQIPLLAFFGLFFFFSIMMGERSLLLIIMCGVGFAIALPKPDREAEKLERIYQTFKTEICSTSSQTQHYPQDF